MKHKKLTWLEFFEMLPVETKKKNCTMNTCSKSRNQTARAALYNTGILCVYGGSCCLLCSAVLLGTLFFSVGGPASDMTVAMTGVASTGAGGP